MKLSKKLRNSPLIFKGIIKSVTPSKSSASPDKSPEQEADESFPNIHVDTRKDDDDDICSVLTEKCEDDESIKSPILPDRSFTLPEEARDEMHEETRDDDEEVGDCKERVDVMENVDDVREVVWSWSDLNPNTKADEAGPEVEPEEKVELSPPIGCRPSCGEFIMSCHMNEVVIKSNSFWPILL